MNFYTAHINTYRYFTVFVLLASVIYLFINLLPIAAQCAHAASSENGFRCMPTMYRYHRTAPLPPYGTGTVSNFSTAFKGNHSNQ